MDRSIKTLKFAFSLKSVILSRPQMFKLQQKILKFKGICLARQKRSKKLGKIEVLRTSVFFSILVISFISFLLILETSIKGVLTPKTHRLFFHGIVLIILCKNSLVQSFKVCWSVLTKLWSYKGLSPAWVTSYPRMHKTFSTGFLGTFLLILWTKNFLHSFMVVLTISY